MSEPGGRTSESLTFTRDTSRAVDRLALDEFAMPSILLMENAARSATEAAIEALGGRLGPVLIVAGPGNNGGDGFAMARHLHNAGCPVSIVLLSEPKAGTDAAVNLEIARRMRLPIAAEIASTVVSLPGPPALVVDAIFGTGLTRAVDGPAAEAIARIAGLRAGGAKVLAVDIPSGLDCDTGAPQGPTIAADVTVTFVGMKQGFLNARAKPFLGRVVVADIGVPCELVLRLGRPADEPGR